MLGWIDTKNLSDIVRQRSGLHRSDDVFLVNPASQFVIQPKFSGSMAVLRKSVYSEAVKRCLAGNSGVMFTNDYRNIASIIVYRWLPRHKMGLVTKTNAWPRGWTTTLPSQSPLTSCLRGWASDPSSIGRDAQAPEGRWIKGIAHSSSNVGPSLKHFRTRSYVAGVLTNSAGQPRTVDHASTAV